GSIGAGLYTAPSSPGTFHVVATNVADEGVAGEAEVEVPPVTISLSPSSTTVLAGTILRFRAAVRDAPADLVKWSLSDARAGFIDDGGLFAASKAAGAYSVSATCTMGVGPPGTAEVALVSSLPGGADLRES